MAEGSNRGRALITGCSSGFGLLTAVRAAGAGFDVVATVHSLSRTEALQQALDAAGTTATIDELDVTDAVQVKDIAEKYSPLDVLVNNAGDMVTGSLMDLPESQARRIFETNYFGAVALTRAVVGPMLQRRRGRIINVASLAGVVGFPYNSAYAASKHAVIGFTQSIRVELAPFGIDVVAVAPGFSATKMLASSDRLSEHFLDPQNPLYEYNRGYLRAMARDVLPHTGRPEAAAKRIVRLMTVRRPKAQYLVGLDARFAVLCQRLGLFGWLEWFMRWRVERGRRLENARDR